MHHLSALLFVSVFVLSHSTLWRAGRTNPLESGLECVYLCALVYSTISSGQGQQQCRKRPYTLLEVIPALGEQLAFNLEDASLHLSDEGTRRKACLRANLVEFWKRLTEWTSQLSVLGPKALTKLALSVVLVNKDLSLHKPV